MRLVHALGAAVAATTLMGSVAKATLTLSLVQVPVPSGAATSIGGTTPVRTFDLKVTQTASEKFDVANLQVSLATDPSLSGYFYASPTHSNTTAIKSNVPAAVDPLDVYDTYVTSPAVEQANSGASLGTSLAVTGSADWPVGPGSATAVVPTNAGVGNSVGHNQTLNVVWGDPQSAGVANTSTATTYTVAQFTIVGNAGAFLKGYLGSSTSGNTPQFFTPNGTGALATLPAGVMYIPVLGDTNNDGVVGLADYNNVQNNFGVTTSVGDTNGDGIIGLADYNNVQNNFGFVMNYSAPPGAALGSLVPEPGSIGLLLASAVFGLKRRRSAR